jgi:hypothetical protein
MHSLKNIIHLMLLLKRFYLIAVKHGSKLLTQVLSAVGVSTRLQLAYLNLLNITLVSDAPQRIVSSFTIDQGLITDLIGFLDHGMTILRAKALVALCILTCMLNGCVLIF